MQCEILTKDGVKKANIGLSRAIRLACLDCSAFYENEVRNCELSKCPLYPYRMGHVKKGESKRTKAVHDYCVECMAGRPGEIKRCVSYNCPLYNFVPAKINKYAKKRKGLNVG